MLELIEGIASLLQLVLEPIIIIGEAKAKAQQQDAEDRLESERQQLLET